MAATGKEASSVVTCAIAQKDPPTAAASRGKTSRMWRMASTAAARSSHVSVRSYTYARRHCIVVGRSLAATACCRRDVMAEADGILLSVWSFLLRGGVFLGVFLARSVPWSVPCEQLVCKWQASAPWRWPCVARRSIRPSSRSWIVARRVHARKNGCCASRSSSSCLDRTM